MMQLEQQDQQIQDGRDDFDFFLGQWKSTQRRLRERLVGSNEWEEFTAHSVASKILGGLGHMDEVTFHRESGVSVGLTVRLFNPTTQEWSIYWAASSYPTGVLELPQIGKFKDGVGEFYALDTHQGRHIFCRFIWKVSSPDRCHWEQAFSEDAGKTWETNWYADFERIPAGQA
jgi:hypothetical protein